MEEKVVAQIVSLDDAANIAVQRRNGNIPDYFPSISEIQEKIDDNWGMEVMVLREYQQKMIDFISKQLVGDEYSSINRVLQAPPGSGKTTVPFLALPTWCRIARDNGLQDNEPMILTLVCRDTNVLKRCFDNNALKTGILSVIEEGLAGVVHVVAGGENSPFATEEFKSFANDHDIIIWTAEAYNNLNILVKKGEMHRPLIINIVSQQKLFDRSKTDNNNCYKSYKKLILDKKGVGYKGNIFISDDGHIATGSSDGQNYNYNTENSEGDWSDVAMSAWHEIRHLHKANEFSSATPTREMKGDSVNDKPKQFQLDLTISKDEVRDYMKDYIIDFTKYGHVDLTEYWDDITLRDRLDGVIQEVISQRTHMKKIYDIKSNQYAIVHVGRNSCKNGVYMKRIKELFEGKEELEFDDDGVGYGYKIAFTKRKEFLFYDSAHGAVVYDPVEDKFVQIGNSLNDCVTLLDKGKYKVLVVVDSATIGFDSKSITFQHYWKNINKIKTFLSEIQRWGRPARFNDVCDDFPYKTRKDYKESENYNPQVASLMNVAKIYICGASKNLTSEQVSLFMENMRECYHILESV